MNTIVTVYGAVYFAGTDRKRNNYEDLTAYIWLHSNESDALRWDSINIVF